MRKNRVGLIRVVTLNDEELLQAHANKLERNFPQLEVITRCIPDQPEGVHDIFTEKAAEPKIIKLARELEAEGVEAVFISCAADPALEECRNILNIPVIGAGSACAALAAGISDRIGVLGIMDTVPVRMAEILGKKNIAAVKPQGVTLTLHLLDEAGKKHTFRAAEYLRSKGCDTIALACTGMSTMGIAQELKAALKIHVIDPVLAAGFFLSYSFREQS